MAAASEPGAVAALRADGDASPSCGPAPRPDGAIPSPAPALSSTDVARFHRRLVDGGVPATSAEQVELLRALEELKSAATAAQAAVALAVDATTRSEEARDGVPARRRGRDVGLRVGLALRQSPARAQSFLGAARAWHTEMPHTLAALRAGRLTAWRATLLAKETAHLPVEARAAVDAQLCADPRVLDGLGDQALAGRARKAADTLDPAAAVQRARRAKSERSVSIRPAPDTMTCLTALLPVAQGVGAYAALRRAADAARATGDTRSRGQVMADTLVELVTGRTTAESAPLTLNLVVSDATLLGAGHEPGVVLDEHGAAAGGVGPVPAQVARNLAANALDADATWVRRLYADAEGQLVAASSSRRFYADGLATVLRLRDQGMCRTPYCGAPVRHLDHVVPVARGGPTTLGNGQGLCVACNLAKDTPRVEQSVEHASGAHTVTTRTATGHVYRSTAPPAPRPAVAARSAPASRSALASRSTGRRRHARTARRPRGAPVRRRFRAAGDMVHLTAIGASPIERAFDARDDKGSPAWRTDLSPGARDTRGGRLAADGDTAGRSGT